MKIKALLLLIGAGLPLTCLSDNLLSIYQDAESNDAQYTSAKALFDATQERIPQSTAALRPSVALSANTTWNKIDSNTGGNQSYNSNGYTISLTQPIYRPQSNIAVDQSKVLVEQAKAQLELARQDLLIRVSQAYFDVLLAQDTLATLKLQRGAIEEQLASTSKKFEIGTSTITDIRDAKARFDLVSAQVIAAQHDLISKKQTLRVITNKEPGTLAPLQPNVKISAPMPNDMEEWAKAAESSGMAVVAGQAALDIARQEVRKARAAHYPTVDLTATHGNSKSGTTTTIGTDLDTNTIGIQFSLPIYSGGGVVSHEKEVASLLNKAQADLDNTRRAGALAARQSFLSLNSGLAQAMALEEALNSARTALESNKRGLEVGVRVDIDVLNAQQQVSATERDLAKAKYDTLMALLRLKAVAGNLGVSDLQEINGLLQKN
jgi:outer membrane protein